MQSYKVIDGFKYFLMRLSVLALKMIKMELVCQALFGLQLKKVLFDNGGLKIRFEMVFEYLLGRKPVEIKELGFNYESYATCYVNFQHGSVRENLEIYCVLKDDRNEAELVEKLKNMPDFCENCRKI